MDTHQHWSSERAAVLPPHLRCDLFVRSSSTDQGPGARTHLWERKSCIKQVCNLKDDALLPLDRSRH